MEELLKKLPGIQVDRNGEIKAMGETVEKVLVDGEEFLAMTWHGGQNLRADAVKPYRFLTKKSEQAEFTGIDDGKTQNHQPEIKKKISVAILVRSALPEDCSKCRSPVQQ